MYNGEMEEKEMELFHVLNRGVDKRDIVIDDHDRVRFMHDLYVFNDLHPTLHYKLQRRQKEDRPRKLLVKIHAFCLMSNHYHLILSPIIENGIALFMKKLSMGYTKYFNERYTRSGALWQGKYKRIPILSDSHFLYIPYYVHLNALDFTHPEWRTGGVRDTKQALTSLNNYRWSSHLDYCGIKNFPSITHRSFLSPILGTSQAYEKEIKNIITHPNLAEHSMTLE